MKRIIAVALSFMCILGLSIPTYAKEEKTVDNSLTPYQKVIDQLNTELGTTFYIPDENKEKFYNNIKGKKLDEFEALIRDEYKTFTSDKLLTTQSSGDYTRDSAVTDNQNESIITPMYIREPITQTVSIRYNSEMYLDSTIFSPSGSLGTYHYESIQGYGSQWPSSFTGFHFEVDRATKSLSSDQLSCTITLYGHPEDKNGLAQGLYLTAKNTFYAN